jgi:CS domain
MTNENNVSNANGNGSDANMTTSERLEWLRERVSLLVQREEESFGFRLTPVSFLLMNQGVLIETPEERKTREVAQAINGAEALAAAAGGADGETSKLESEKIKFVLIPADTSKPIQDLTFSAASTLNTDQLIEFLKPAFGAKKSGDDHELDLNLLNLSTSQTLLAAGGGELPTPSEDALRKVASDAHVETFTVVNGVPSNAFTTVVMYLDEVGMLKRLPINTRAAKLTERAGFNPPPTIYGNVFVARHQKSAKGLTHLSFSSAAGDMAPDAPWLLSATQDNITFQKMIHGGRIPSETQPAVAGTDGKVAQEAGAAFSWSQTEDEIEVTVLRPPSVVSPKDLQVQFRAQQVAICSSKIGDSDPPLFGIEHPNNTLRLFEKVDVDGCTWTLDKIESDPKEKGRKLILTMEKVEQALWPRIRE